MSVHARVHGHMFMFSIGPVAESCLHTESALVPTGLFSHRHQLHHPTLSITEPYSNSKFRLSRSVLLGTNTMLQLNENVCKPLYFYI